MLKPISSWVCRVIHNLGSPMQNENIPLAQKAWKILLKVLIYKVFFFPFLSQFCIMICSICFNVTVSQVHGILQARTLQWVALPFSRGSSQPRYQTQVSHIPGGFFTH